MAIMVETKYSVLRIVSVIYKVFAVIFAIIMLIAGLAAMGSSATVSSYGGGSSQVVAGGIFGGFFIIISGILGGIFLWAWGEMIILFIDVEENTRKTSILLQQRDRV